MILHACTVQNLFIKQQSVLRVHRDEVIIKNRFKVNVLSLRLSFIKSLSSKKTHGHVIM